MPTRFTTRTRLLSCLLTLAMLLSLVPVSAFAADTTESFEMGAFGYTINEDNSSVTCNGFVKGHKDDTAADIPAEVTYNDTSYPVTAIGAYAFWRCKSLTNIAIPAGVTAIGANAFYECESLTSITIPAGVTAIGANAFYECESLTSITIPDGVTTIAESTFERCESLTNITLPDSVTTIGDDAFECCYKLTSITIPAGVTAIGANAFYYCTSLTDITIPDGVTTIADRTFNYCESLTNITIPDGVTTIGDWAFSDCYVLHSIAIPASVTSIGRAAFKNCTRGFTTVSFAENSQLESIGDEAFSWGYRLTNITIPASVTRIGTRAFYNCDALTTVSFEENSQLESIEESAFRGCQKLTRVTIPNGVTDIGSNAFQNCKKLIGVAIPVSVTRIGTEPFKDCESLEAIYYGGTREQWESLNVTFDEGQEVEIIPAQDHMASPEWKYDENTHWHPCREEGCPTPGVKLEEAEHTFKWVVDEEQTGDTIVMNEQCGICGAKSGRSQSVPAASGRHALAFEDCTVEVDGETYTESPIVVAAGAKVTLKLDESRVPGGMKFNGFVINPLPAPDEMTTEGTTATFTMPYRNVTVYVNFCTEEEESTMDFGAVLLGTAAVGAAGLAVYHFGTEIVLEKLLPEGTAIPKTKGELALLLWNEAGRPEDDPVSEVADLADITDPDMAKAVQWAVDNGVLTRNEDGTFHADKRISKIRVIRSWKEQHS